MAAFELLVSTAVHGYHIYKDEWLPETTDTFCCRQEVDNKHDRFGQKESLHPWSLISPF
jgi:hypothetical protein